MKNLLDDAGFIDSAIRSILGEHRVENIEHIIARLGGMSDEEYAALQSLVGIRAQQLRVGGVSAKDADQRALADVRRMIAAGR